MVNITSLTLGLTFIILITSFVLNELSYDKYHKNADDLCYVSKFYPDNQGSGSYGVTPGPLAEEMKAVYPEVIKAARTVNAGRIYVKYKEHHFLDQSFYLADQDILDILTVNFLSGNKEKALQEPNSIIISSTLAKKYFNYKNPLGENLVINNSRNFKVTGVFKDLPFNTHFRFDLMGSLSKNTSGWDRNSYYTYVKLKPDSSMKDFEFRLQGTLSKHYGADTKDRLKVIPLPEMFLHPGMEYPIQNNANPVYIYILSCIGLVLLIIIVFNHMNITLAFSVKRVKELTIKRVIGVKRIQLILQFIGESTLILLIAFLFSILTAIILRPIFCTFVERQISFKFLLGFKSLIFFLLLTLISGVVSGVYPGILLSSKKLIKGLPGKNNLQSFARNSLILLQFGISIVLIFSTITIFKQLDFMNNKNLGFNKEQIVTIPMYGSNITKKIKIFKDNIKNNSRIISCTNSTFLPNNILSSDSIQWEGRNSKSELSIWINQVDKNFLKTFEIELLHGSEFENISDNSTRKSFIINETAVKEFGFISPLGKQIRIGGEPGTITGIMKDFHSRNLIHPVEPLALILQEDYSYARTVSIQVYANDLPGTLRYIEKVYKEVTPGFPFRYNVFGDIVDQQYQADKKLFKIIVFAALMVILISSVGLLGFISYSLENKKKEIGIRKVLGSSTRGILVIIGRWYLVMISVALVISLPLSTFIMNSWLKQFAFRVNPEPAIYLLSTFSIFFITILTVGYQSMKAASNNPVNTLKCE